ncbi:MAG TPA: hypothetical protein PLT76_06625 [Candidatus Omnitrophota bacterium]|nr:hypothetical protein [Candidatus Omnitrophota bacterium]HPB68060.1 hypothetical protein [Candidatus Omnitrophota bacterium]HQO58381.1 hypothetical protein [Candidatus Omnitrophota bacterium]HQP12387.1 hypothetical protein [Candidatus Omnitrophota bacterium]
MIQPGRRKGEAALFKAAGAGGISLLFFLGLFLCTPRLVCAGLALLPAQEREVRSYLRNNFEQALEEECFVDDLLAYLRHKIPGAPEHFSPALMAYYGALQGLKAKYSALPAQKLHYLKVCLKYLDQAVQSPGADLETYFLRFSSLHHLPPFFDIPKKRSEDIQMICRLLEKRDYSVLDREFQLKVVDFMLQSRRLNAQQTKELSVFKSALAGF